MENCSYLRQEFLNSNSKTYFMQIHSINYHKSLSQMRISYAMQSNMLIIFIPQGESAISQCEKKRNEKWENPHLQKKDEKFPSSFCIIKHLQYLTRWIYFPSFELNASSAQIRNRFIRHNRVLYTVACEKSIQFVMQIWFSSLSPRPHFQ